MFSLPLLVLALVGLSPVVQGVGSGYGSGNNYGGGDSPPMQIPPVASAGSASAPNVPVLAANSTVDGVNGDIHCVPLMCISATVLPETIQFVLQSTGSRQVGWMAMGFGKNMVGSPLVVMWANQDGSITVSQRKATSRSLPATDPNPPRVATLSTDISVATGSQPKFAYTVPIDPDNKPNIVFAFGTDTPSSSDPDAAKFKQHVSFGRFTMDLTRAGLDPAILATPVLSLAKPGPSSASASVSSSSSAEKVILAHAVVCTLVFLVVMPAGALLARFYRTFSPKWFKGHWILQFGVAGPLAVVGAILASSIARAGGPQVFGLHAQVGVLLFILYALQCSLGGFIHFLKPKNAKRRPLQNYAHALLGLTIIALAFYQVRTGYTTEWPNAVGRPAPRAINVLWYFWVVVLPVAYAGGLLFLKKQYAQEAAARAAPPKRISWQEAKGYAV